MAMYFAFDGALVGAFVGAFVRLPTCFGRLRMGSEQGFYLNCSVRTKWFARTCVLVRREGQVWIVGKKAEVQTSGPALSLTPSPALPRIPSGSGGILI